MSIDSIKNIKTSIAPLASKAKEVAIKVPAKIKNGDKKIMAGLALMGAVAAAGVAISNKSEEGIEHATTPDGTKQTFKNGKLISEKFADGSLKGYNDNGTLFFEKNADGSSKFYNDDGTVSSETNADGVSKDYYDDGTTSISTDELTQHYDADGKLSDEMFRKQGVMKLYKDNGSTETLVYDHFKHFTYGIKSKFSK